MFAEQLKRTSAFHGYIKKSMKNELKINTQKSRRKSRKQKDKVIKRGKNLNREKVVKNIISPRFVK